MNGLVGLRGLAHLRQRAYIMLLAAGASSLFALLSQDLKTTLYPGEGGAVPAAAVPAGAGRFLTNGASLDGFSAWGSGGQQIAFMRDGAIWIIGVDGKGERLLSRAEGAWDTAPAWSPDGKRLAFVRVNTQSGNSTILLTDANGAAPTTLWTEKAQVGYLAWSPDGRFLVYSTQRALMRLDLPARTARELHLAPDDWDLTAGGIAVSRDGKQVIFGAGKRTGLGIEYDLFSLPTAAPAPGGAGGVGGPATPATPARLTTGGGIMPAFDAAGAQLAYRNPRMASGIYIMDWKAKSARRVLPDGPDEMYFHPAFSPDGKLLAVSRLRLDGGPGTGTGGGGNQRSARLISNLYLFDLDQGR